MNQGSVRIAAPADLPFIHEWLKLEIRDGIGFINNWPMIQDACIHKQMIVFVDSEGPIGFLTYGISRDTILQTKSDRQRCGVGRALVKHAIQIEEAQNNAVLVVQCAPRSSVEFWTQMGFEAHREAEHSSYQHPIYMQRRSTAARPGVRGEDLDLVTVRVYPETVLYSKEPVKPDRVHYVMAAYDDQSRTLELAHRISIAAEPMLKDPVVEVCWGGLDIVMGKAKHEQAAAVGFKRTPNHCGFYLDVIKIPEIV